MIPRNLAKVVKRFLPCVVSFLIGIILTLSINSPETDYSTSIGNDLPLFQEPSVTLLVLVISSPGNSELRNVIRETWLSISKKNHKFKSYFVIGDKDVNSKQVYDLSLEKSRYGDLMTLHLLDSYSTLTNKVIKSFEFSHQNIRFNYLLKCDDDTFVDLEKLLGELELLTEPNLYLGFFDGRAPVQTRGKWADTEYRLCDRYIPYALGGGYVLGRQMVEFLASNSHLLQQFNSEDVSIGAWLSGTKAVRKHDPRFDTEWKSRGCSNKFIVTHKQTAADMKVKWKRLSKTGTLCDTEETKVRLSYIYDWNKPPSECCLKDNHNVP